MAIADHELDGAALRPQRRFLLDREKRGLQCIELSLANLFLCQSSGGRRYFKFVREINAADAGVVGVDGGEQAVDEHLAQGMTRQVGDGAGVNITR